MKTFISIIVLLMFNTAVFADSTIDRILATVNDDIITQSELNKRIVSAKSQLNAVGVKSPEEKSLNEQVLNRLIEERLILQQADMMGMQIDDSTLNKAITSIANSNNTDLDGFRTLLESDGYDFIEFREQIRKDMLIKQVQQQRVGYNIMVSEEEVDRLVGELSQKDSPATQYRVGHILVALPRNPSSDQVQLAQARASDAIAALKKTSDFTQVALQYSDNSNVLEQADLGWRTKAQLPSLIADIVPTMQVNEIHKPIRNSSGLHIIQLLEKREQVLQSAQKDMQRQQAKEYLYQQKLQEAMQAWLNQLRDGAHVDVKV